MRLEIILVGISALVGLVYLMLLTYVLVYLFQVVHKRRPAPAKTVVPTAKTPSKVTP